MPFEHTIDHNQANDIVLRAWQDKLHTALPGFVESYDPDTKTAAVRPVFIDNFLLDGKQRQTAQLDYDTHPRMCVVFPRGGNWSDTWPLKKGDAVLIICSQRSIDEWYNSDGTKQVSPANPRMHDITDAFCIPGLFPKNNAKGKANHKDRIISCTDSGAALVVEPKLKIGSESAGTPLANGTVTKNQINAINERLTQLSAILALPPVVLSGNVESSKAFTND